MIPSSPPTSFVIKNAKTSNSAPRPSPWASNSSPSSLPREFLRSSLCPAESLQNALFGEGRHRVLLKARSLLVWPRDYVQKILERLEILPQTCGIERDFNQVIAGNECRIHLPHPPLTLPRPSPPLSPTPTPPPTP